MNSILKALIFSICFTLSFFAFAEDKNTDNTLIHSLGHGLSIALEETEGSVDKIMHMNIYDKQAVTDVAAKEGQSILPSEQLSLDEKINKHLDFNFIKTSFFNGFRFNETFTHAMLNSQEDTGDPLFMVQAHQDGVLEDNYIYFGTATSSLGWAHLGNNHGSAKNRYFSYDMDAYVASTIGSWVNLFAGFSLYSRDEKHLNFDPNSLYAIVGNFSKFPVMAYVANSTVNYGNFDILSNFVPTLTRLYFMQAGGNVNVTYNTDSWVVNGALMSPNSNSYFGATNVGLNGSGGVAYSLNSKYTYDMATAGEYIFAGLAYTNATGFKNKTNKTVGALDFNMGAAISSFNLRGEFLVTDKSVSGINSSSSVSPENIAGVQFFSSIKPSADLIYDGFLDGDSMVTSWAAQINYTANIFEKRLIPYLDYSHIAQSSRSYAYNMGVGGRYNVFSAAWLGLDYTHTKTHSSNFNEGNNFLSLSFRVYI